MKKCKCVICGKEFYSIKSTSKICKADHYQKCPTCGELVLWNKTAEFKGCKKCIQKAAVEKRKKTMLERYGGETTFQSKVLRDKYRNTILDKYGVDNPMKNVDIYDKVKHTNLIKYGVENPMSNKDIAKKSASTRSKNMDEIVEHIKQTWMEKYGVDNVSKCPEIIDKITSTFIQRYGVKRAIDVPEFRDKMIHTMMEKYGVPWYVQSDTFRRSNFFRVSETNRKFADLLTSAGYEFEMEYGIDTKNYDFFLPSFKTLIEIDPTYTHNIIGNHWNPSGVSTSYHLEKSRLAIEHGFRCIHVFDWDNWSDIVNMLDTKLAVYARDCSIYKLKTEVTDLFLESNHIQGTCRGQDVSLGLVKDGELYMVMTFGRSRYNKNYSVELLRMATKRGYRVVGGASKLFQYFVNTYEIYSIISYCDLSKFKGDVYEKIGMKHLRNSPPQEIWSKGCEKITANLLRQRGYDQLFGTDYGKGTSNEQLMLENGWLPVYDCGQGVYIFDESCVPHI